MKIKKNVFLSFIIQLILIGIACTGMIVLQHHSQNDKEFFLGWISIISLILFAVNIYKHYRNHALTIGMLFVIFLYLFNLGIPISRALGWINEYTELYVLNKRIYPLGKELFNTYLIFAFAVISFLEIGLFAYFEKSAKLNIYFFEKIELQEFRKMGIILMVIGMVPYFYSEYIYIRHSVIYGYQNADYLLDMSGTGLGLIGNLFILGFFYYIYSVYQNKKRFDFCFILFSLYQIFRMFITGDRSTGLSIILVLFVLRSNLVSKLNARKFFTGAILVYITLIALKFIEIFRGTRTLTFSEIVNTLVKKNMIAETVCEYGGNVWSAVMVFYSVPGTSYFRLGTTYLAAIVGKPLSILGVTNSVWKYADFSNFLMETERGSLVNSLTESMGGSFIGELWFNFGYFSIFIALFFGILLGKFSIAIFKKNKKNYLYFMPYFLYIATLVVWWVRQYFTTVAWSALFYGIVIFILHSIVKNKKNRSV